ncbi:M48 family metallopeptidase [Bacteroides acidifaciens]|uniref:M48 family metallopeptidase n=1 Tax=Bacteroides acidifaciens TaxID=85831 RepID=UPI00260928C7|nr:M48 family metallopeptidase [Bacteroides acidifaciens]
MKLKTILRKIDLDSVMHDDDKSTISKLNKIPGFKGLVDNTVGNIMEKCGEIEYSGEGINVTPKSMPQLHRQFVEACRILGMEEIPSFSVDWWFGIGGFTVGEKHRRMVLQSGAIDLLTPEEMFFMMGHELGHMKCGHKRYHMLTEALYMPVVNSDLKIWMSLIKMPLLNWYRYSDFTADRMGLLCCQDIRVALSTMIKMAGLPKKYFNMINIETFVQQAIDFNNNQTSSIDKLIKYLSINAASMPWLVLRAAELLKWYQSGQYDKIINQNKKLHK